MPCQSAGIQRGQVDISPTWFEDQIFWLATRQRIQALDVPADSRCCLPATGSKKECAGPAGEEKQCGAYLGSDARHVWHCASGAAKLRVHRHVQHCLAFLVRQAGGTADLERPVASMAKRRANGTLHEAVMDVDVAFPSVLRLWHIDVSVRSPTSDRYASAQLQPEHALRAAVREKLARYGPGVSPIVLGALGRVEAGSAETLRTMAAASEASASEPGSSSSRTAAAWQQRLQRTVHWAQAATLALALGSVG